MRYLVSRVLEGREKDKTKKGGGEREKERKGRVVGGTSRLDIQTEKECNKTVERRKGMC